MHVTRHPNCQCASAEHLSRRTLLKLAGMAGISWLTPVAEILALEAEKAPKGKPARSVILLWLAGGPSQLDTFDPHPGSPIAEGIGAIGTAIKNVQFAPGLEQTAGVMQDVSLIRSMVSKEVGHEQAFYNIQTGYRPTPNFVHPSIGAILCHELPDSHVEIPSHISIMPGQWPARGGFFGTEYDAFLTGDPRNPVPDLSSPISTAKFSERMDSLKVVERAFAQGRRPDLDEHTTLHRVTMAKARRMMTSDQLKAFDVSLSPASERARYGDTPFGRGCLAALRLIEVGVRCVEVTLNGWDTHYQNRERQADQVKILDPAFAALVQDLKLRGLLEHTVVICGGEFGRTPQLNPNDGRDHWPHGFSMLMAGGGFAGGRVLGATDPNGVSKTPDKPVAVEDLHASVQHLLGIDPSKVMMTPAGRPFALSEGRVLHGLMA